MFYAITDQGVLSASTLKQLNNKSHVLLEQEEFTAVGADFVTKLTERDIDFIQDKARVSNIMFGNFFRKDNSPKIFMIVNIILSALILFTK